MAPAEPNDPKPKRPFKVWKRPVLPHERKADVASAGAGTLVTAGIEFAIIVGLLTWVGRWLDARFGWDPWGTAVLAMVGVGAALTLLIGRVRRIDDASRRAKAAEQDEGKSPDA